MGVQFGPGALELLLARTGPNTRLLIEEVHKLAAHGAEGAPIEESSVAEMTPNTAQGEFFESAEAFFSGDLTWTLAALKRHFFAGGDGRPILAGLQNRNRILIQVRALADSGEARVGPRGIEGLQRAAEVHGSKFGDAVAEKSSYNIFTQNSWYVGKLAASGKLPTLRRLIDNQREFVAALEQITLRSKEQEEVLRDMAVRCLAG
jgi:DNA polymerase-3 subunit delta